MLRVVNLDVSSRADIATRRFCSKITGKKGGEN